MKDDYEEVFIKESLTEFDGDNMANKTTPQNNNTTNNNNEVIKKISELQKDEANKEKVDLLCKQVVDLALIANNDLKGEDLEEFINRSMQLMI